MAESPAALTTDAQAWEAGLRRHLETLAGDIGERHLGSEGEVKALDYMEREFREAGYEVEREPFDTVGYRYGQYRLALASGEESFTCFPCFFSNGCNVRGTLVPCDFQTPEKLDEVSLEGRIVFVYGQLGGVLGANELAERLDQRGAAALIITSAYESTMSTKLVRSPNLDRMAVVSVSRDTARAIAHHRHEEFVLEVEAGKFPWQSCNMIARLGAERPRIIIGAHYDTGPGMAGAADNGTGTAFLLEAARRMKTEVEGHGIHLIAFGGEEFASVGSKTYVRDHQDQLSELHWMASVDDVSVLLGRTAAFTGMVNDERMQRVIEQAVAGSEIAFHPDHPGASDNCNFGRAGVNAFQFGHVHPGSHVGAGPFPLHSPKDNLSVIDWEAFGREGRLMAQCFQRLLTA